MQGGNMRSVLKLGVLVVVAPLVIFCAPSPAAGQQLSNTALSQITDLLNDKRSRTLEEQKLDPNLIYAARAVIQTMSANAIPRPAFVDSFIAENVATDNTVAVTIRANASESLLALLAGLGAQEVVAFPAFDTVTARLALSELRTVAAHVDVRFISPLDKPLTNRYVSKTEAL